MSEHDKLVKRLNKYAETVAFGSDLREAAQAIERLVAELAELRQTHTDKALAWDKCQELRSELAEARAREEDRQEAIRAALKVLPRQREPHPDDDLQGLMNLACSLLDDALTDFAPEPAPEREAERLNDLLECDRSTVADGISAIKKAIQQREWLRLGRGSYEYDDDRWKDEFGQAIDDILLALEPLQKVASNWADCPTKRGDIARARALAAQQQAPESESD